VYGLACAYHVSLLKLGPFSFVVHQVSLADGAPALDGPALFEKAGEVVVVWDFIPALGEGFSGLASMHLQTRCQ